MSVIVQAPVGGPSFLKRMLRSPSAGAGLFVVAVILLAALLAPVIAPYDPNLQETANRLMPPTLAHWFGTDAFGRDILSRLIYGARPTLLLVLVVVLLMAPLGIVVGILAGFFGGLTERLLMRVTDIVMSFPRLLLAFAFVAIMGPGLINGALALALTSWPAYARQARVETAALRRSDYLAAAEMVGIKGVRLLWGHILPLVLPSAIIRLALDLSGIILAAAGLGFLGLGVRPPTAEWGSMVSEGTQVIFDQWWVAAVPGLAIFITSFAFNLLADGLRDILDPRHD
ncbi:ABC transporter permease [Rhizobium leguminosarum]|uniref:ABC transporter permease n=1 Tax=Rhizobium leguminosarum TaxID=384 RepID=A0ABD7PVI9_RHILE|nr:ABC transporter permease [Rhizobium leguminosarum]TAV79773.1 ABC transporter permease [Rhizobium leguminosarum]TAW31109.1 ABC transporter permease [Rhizobium leguminosarum]TAW44837.1 ABC transporter permease [Rhizobium leguminosarum]TAZ31504.1 ABC transporter permease [Rhizobium leguminosarum]